ncbi:hypothetical protein LY76DRAFT_172491 [Colletotrichum caudatum]|nr:hypothetical protein LY76DRAFT_172491 [Colletotrichum caudatum]
MGLKGAARRRSPGIPVATAELEEVGHLFCPVLSRRGWRVLVQNWTCVRPSPSAYRNRISEGPFGEELLSSPPSCLSYMYTGRRARLRCRISRCFFFFFLFSLLLLFLFQKMVLSFSL